MARPSNAVPTYRIHSASGRGRSRHNGRDVYFPGAFNSPESLRAYARFLETLTSAPDTILSRPAPPDASIAELVLRYDRHNEVYYQKNGRPTGERATLRSALRPMVDLFGDLPAAQFAPQHLKAVQQEMIRRDFCRRYLNASIRRIRRFFGWAVEEGRLCGEVAAALKAVKPIKRGRSAAREKPKIAAVPDEIIEKVLADRFISRQVHDLVRVQRLTGMRPGEVLSLAVEEIDRTDPDCWKYTPSSHKTEHWDRERTIWIGPRAVAILLPRIQAVGTGKVFGILSQSYWRSLRGACIRVGVTPFAANALRHSFASAVRKASGLDAVQVALGHASAKTSEIYAELDMSKARDVAKLVG